MRNLPKRLKFYKRGAAAKAEFSSWCGAAIKACRIKFSITWL